MDVPPLTRSIRPLGLGLLLLAALEGSAQAQATAEATCTVRIRPRAGADYDPLTEVLLRGRLAGRSKGLLLLRLTSGIVRVDAGGWDGGGLREPGAEVEILAARHLEEGRQWFLAREVRHAGGRVVIRDAQGVLRPQGSAGLAVP